MQKSKAFEQVHFDDLAIRQCRDAFLAEVDETKRQGLSRILSAVIGDEQWEYDNEDELFADIRRGVNSYSYRILGNGYDLIVRESYAVVSLKTRAQIERVRGAADRGRYT